MKLKMVTVIASLILFFTTHKAQAIVYGCGTYRGGSNWGMDGFSVGTTDNFVYNWRETDIKLERLEAKLNNKIDAQSQKIAAADRAYLADLIVNIFQGSKFLDETAVQKLQEQVNRQLEAKYQQQIKVLLQAVSDLNEKLSRLQERMDGE